MLATGAALALSLATGPTLLTGCGPVRLGGPEQYSPPPPGIDDLYRTDLITLLERAIAGNEALAQASAGGPSRTSALSEVLSTLSDALPVQRAALLTGAQRERELDAAEDPDPNLPSPSPPPDAPQDLGSLVAALVELRDLGAMAARQVSGALARPVAALAAHAQWAAVRLHTAGDQGEVPPTPSAEEIVPSRQVPETDPPSIGAPADHHLAIETAQEQEWYAGYFHEVLAARTEDEAERTAHLDTSQRHRARAQDLGETAEEDGAPVVPRQAVYALPGQALDDAAEQLPTQLAHGLLLTHVTVVGAAPFDRRALSIAAALEEATVLAGHGASLEPLPSLVPDDERLGTQGQDAPQEDEG